MDISYIGLASCFNLMSWLLCILLILFLWALVAAIAHIVVTYEKIDIENGEIIRGLPIMEVFVHINIRR